MQARHRARFLAPVLLALGAGGLVAAGCSSTTASTTNAAGAGATPANSAAPGGSAAPANSRAKAAGYQIVSITTQDYSFDVPTEVRAGLTSVEVTNAGKEPHQVQIGKLNDGVTYDKLDEVLHGPIPDAASSLVTFVGGVDTVDPGHSGSAIVELKAGDYEVLCFLPGSDGKSHLAHGMTKAFTAKAGADAAPEPTSVGEIAAKDMMITLPAGFAGKGAYVVTNAGPSTHEVAIVQLAAGKTKDDALAYLAAAAKGATSGPPPFSDVGGAGAIAPGQKTWIDLDLKPGTYLFLCFIPDVAKGLAPHYAEGMVTEFTQK